MYGHGGNMELKLTALHPGRLSTFLREELNMSAGLMNRLKWQEAILVNGQPVHTDYPVQPEDVICVLLDEPRPDYPAQDGKLNILYEDAHLLVVDKPAGMLIHPSRSCNTGTLANFVLGYYRRTGQQAAFHPLTRLDRDTFGIVLLAKHSHAHARLQAMGVRKTYHGLTYGWMEKQEGRIEAPIARKPLPSLLREVHPDGKPSVTEFRVLEQTEKLCKLELKPITGRTHQLRLHCAHVGHPILGDPQYGSPGSQDFSLSHGLSGQQLCAYRLELCHPITEKAMVLESAMDVFMDKL